jgi:catechol 2,3-dioxygenase
MTQIRGYIEATRRPGVLGVHSLDHFSLTVPDLDKATTFYETFGLDVRKDGKGIALHTHGHPHRWGTLTEGPKKKLHYLSFGAFEDDLPRFREHLNQLGIGRLDAPAGFESNGLWFRDHEGVPVEIRVAEKSSPNAKSVFSVVPGAPGVAAAAKRSQAPTTHPRRLAHILLFTKDVPRAIEFYTRVLGLRLSDSSEGNIAFLHGVHGSDHHLIAFARSEGSGLHHCSWDVGSVEDIGLGAMQMAGKGFTHGWGLGRHVLGSNYFHYVQDPWGSWSEYSADIDFVPSTVDWEAADHLGEDSFYLWGPNVPEDFVRNLEAES